MENNKNKLIAEKRFLHNGQLMEIGEEFEVNASEAKDYLNQGLAKSYDTKQVKANKKSKVSESAMNQEFGEDLTANANQELNSVFNQENTNSFTGQKNEKN